MFKLLKKLEKRINIIYSLFTFYNWASMVRFKIT